MTKQYDPMTMTACRDLIGWYARQTQDVEVRRVYEAFPLTAGLRKSNRWLGYVQGWLSARGTYTVDELRAHIRERVWDL
jgi:hypothetical protein